jgi:germination protein M
MEDPINPSLSRIWPHVDFADFFRGFYFDGVVLIVMFSDLYREMSPLEEALFRSAFTLTMVGMGFIETVELHIEGAEGVLPTVYRETSRTIANSPPVSPTMLSSGQFTLFFIDESGEGLVTEIYEATDVDQHQRERFLIQRLIEGPSNEGTFSAIPEGTRVRDVTPDAVAGVYVNLSREFLTQFSGSSTQARMMLYSIINTLTFNLGHRRVHFLIEAERLEQFHGVVDFHLGFTFDETMMLDYSPPEDEPGENEPGGR